MMSRKELDKAWDDLEKEYDRLIESCNYTIAAMIAAPIFVIIMGIAAFIYLEYFR